MQQFSGARQLESQWACVLHVSLAQDRRQPAASPAGAVPPGTRQQQGPGAPGSTSLATDRGFSRFSLKSVSVTRTVNKIIGAPALLLENVINPQLDEEFKNKSHQLTEREVEPTRKVSPPSAPPSE